MRRPGRTPSACLSFHSFPPSPRHKSPARPGPTPGGGGEIRPRVPFPHRKSTAELPGPAYGLWILQAGYKAG